MSRPIVASQNVLLWALSFATNCWWPFVKMNQLKMSNERAHVLFWPNSIDNLSAEQRDSHVRPSCIIPYSYKGIAMRLIPSTFPVEI